MPLAESLESPVAISPVGFDTTGARQENSPLIDQLSEPIIGKWNVLVSQTNWEKGALILHWRNELIAAGLPNTAYSDDAWAQRVGNVTPRHVGRLRRVAERFGKKNRDFAGLYWSHFHAALDWDDADLWLEGAVQNDWSVAQMRVQRWEAIGGADEHKPQDDDIIVAEIDEDAHIRQPLPERIEGRNREIGAADIPEVSESSPTAMPNRAGEPSPKKEQTKKDRLKQIESGSDVPRTGTLLMSLKGISTFPADIAESLELLKVAILNHKLAGWKSISAEQLCQSLETLKMLTIAED
jgi:hypothetical protein